MVSHIEDFSPEEIRRRKNLKRGINFTLLICGQEGTGKSSFVNSLCKQKVLQRDTTHIDPKESHLNPGIEIVRQHINIIEEESTPIALDIVFTPGFGDNIDNSSCTSKIVEYLEKQFDDVLTEECRIQRDPRFKDGRPHAALYFIRATTKGLRQLDVETMKLLSPKVNIIPVIGKSDSLTTEELKLNKALILQDIRANDIQIYDFPIEAEVNEELSSDGFSLKEVLPFAVAGSYDVEDFENVKYHTRRYPWGVFRTEDPKHSDFTVLRNALFGSHLQELKDSTDNILYEKYRREKLIEHESLARQKTKPFNEDASLFDRYNYKDTSEILPEDETLREILRKKKVIENYTSEIKLMEKQLRVSNLTTRRNSNFNSHSEVISSDVSA